MKLINRPLALFALTLTLLLVLNLVMPSPPAYVREFVVNTTDDLDDGACNTSHCSLREAILAANLTPADVSITFNASGTIHLTSALPDISQDSILTIDGGNQITLDGGSRTRVFLNAGNLTLKNLTISNGAVSDDFGGGIFNRGVLTIINSTFSNNTASTMNTIAGGGAIYNSGHLTIINGSFDSNRAVSTGKGYAEGGAIYNSGEFTEAAISDGTTFRNNEATHHGGAIFNALGYLTVKDSLFDGNRSDQGGGGGIYDRNGASMNIISATLQGNSAAFGGGIFSSSIRTDIRDSVFSNNSARSADGGAIYIHSNSVLNISNSALQNNTAQNGGGVFALGAAHLANVTISGNSGGDCTLGNGGSMSRDSANNLIEGTGSNACGLLHGVDGNRIGLNLDPQPSSDSPAHFMLSNNSSAAEGEK